MPTTICCQLVVLGSVLSLAINRPERLPTCAVFQRPPSVAAYQSVLLSKLLKGKPIRGADRYPSYKAGRKTLRKTDCRLFSKGRSGCRRNRREKAGKPAPSTSSLGRKPPLATADLFVDANFKHVYLQLFPRYHRFSYSRKLRSTCSYSLSFFAL